MNENTELLNFIYQNAQMGVKTIEKLTDIVEDSRFANQLNSQFNEYNEISDKARELLREHNCDEKEVPGFEKFTSYLMINMKTMTDKSPSHIAGMMMQGSIMGIIDATRNIRKYADAESKILDLMKRLLEMEENNIQTLKEYL